MHVSHCGLHALLSVSLPSKVRSTRTGQQKHIQSFIWTLPATCWTYFWVHISLSLSLMPSLKHIMWSTCSWLSWNVAFAFWKKLPPKWPESVALETHIHKNRLDILRDRQTTKVYNASQDYCWKEGKKLISLLHYRTTLTDMTLFTVAAHLVCSSDIFFSFLIFNLSTNIWNHYGIDSINLHIRYQYIVCVNRCCC